MQQIERYENPKICRACAKKHTTCCQSSPGIASPKDFRRNHKSLEENLYVALKSGLWAIDWYAASPIRYFIRPAIKGSEGELWHGAWGGECVFLTESGCKFLYEERPEGCRVLIPSRKSHCGAVGEWSKGYKKHGADLWLLYKKLVEKVSDRIAVERTKDATIS
mgnify:CR=1 FL=1